MRKSIIAIILTAVFLMCLTVSVFADETAAPVTQAQAPVTQASTAPAAVTTGATADTTQATQPTGIAGFFAKYGAIVLLVAMIAIFYFFLYRPQKKQEKATNDMRAGVEAGDEITTIGGIIGKVISIKEETVMIETGTDKTKMRILKSAIRSVDVKAEDADE